MRRFLPLCLALALLTSIFAPLAHAASTTPAKSSDRSPANSIAAAVTTVTGIAISPLLGTGAYGAYKYAVADKAARESLPWFAQPKFFVPALAIALICAFKDVLGTTVPPGLKKPLDVLETLENKISGLIAAGAVIPITMDALSGWLLGGDSAVLPGALQSTGLAMIPLGVIDFTWLLNLLTVPFGIAVFAVVWMASHAINVLILLSPWGAIDAALKAARTAVLGLLTVSATIDPMYSAGLSFVVIVVAALVAGWAYRLTIFGSVFCWDFLSRRKRRFSPAPESNWMFAAGKIPGVPIRSYGRLVRNTDASRATFVYRRLLVLKERTVEVGLFEPCIGRGLFFSTIRDGETTLFLLPPRYRDHEEELVTIYGLKGIQDAGLLKAWGVVRELFGGGAAKAQVV
jgi:hypothetical protein